MRAYIELLINIHLGTSFNLQRNYITATVICNISLGISEQTRNKKKNTKRAWNIKATYIVRIALSEQICLLF